MKIAIFDFECTSLNSDDGFLLCGGIKPLNGKPYVISLRDTGCSTGLEVDKKLAIAIRDELRGFNIVAGWNSKKFDVPFLNDRLMLAGESEFTAQMHVDMMYYAGAFQGRMKSRRLDWVARQLELPVQKTALDIRTWLKAEREALDYFRHGHKAFDSIVHHCVKDLEVTEMVYKALSPRVRNIHR
jgi:uncharacterized protein YprB with RNaseH-like and TPR domain